MLGRFRVDLYINTRIETICTLFDKGSQNFTFGHRVRNIDEFSRLYMLGYLLCLSSIQPEVVVVSVLGVLTSPDTLSVHHSNQESLPLQILQICKSRLYSFGHKPYCLICQQTSLATGTGKSSGRLCFTNLVELPSFLRLN